MNKVVWLSVNTRNFGLDVTVRHPSFTCTTMWNFTLLVIIIKTFFTLTDIRHNYLYSSKENELFLLVFMYSNTPTLTWTWKVQYTINLLHGYVRLPYIIKVNWAPTSLYHMALSSGAQVHLPSCFLTSL